MKARARRWFARFGLALVALGVALALAEVVARVLERPSGFVYERADDGSMVRLTGDEQIYEPIPSNGLFNTLGLRDRTYDQEKPPGVTRVVVLGDSVTYGPTLPLEGTFDNQLEDRLNRARDGHVEVLNLAVPGYNSEQEAARLRVKGLDLDPDLVVVVWTINDFEATPTVVVTDEAVHYVHHARPEIPTILPLPPRVQVGLLRSSAFARLASRSLALATTGGEAQVEALELGKAVNSLALVDIAKTAASADAGVLFVLFPLLGEDGGRRQIDDATAFLEANGLPYIDLGPAMAGHDPMTLRARPQDPMHPSVLGCSLAAEAVAGRILDEGRLDQGGIELERTIMAPDPVDVADVRDTELSAWLEGAALAGDADPLDAADEAFADRRGDAEDEGADLLAFVAATCGDRLCVGVELVDELADGATLHVDLAPFQGRGQGGRIVVDADGEVRVESPRDQRWSAPIRANVDGRVIRVRVPLAGLPGCEQGCDLHVGPAATLQVDGVVLDRAELRYHVAWGAEPTGTPRPSGT